MNGGGAATVDVEEVGARVEHLLDRIADADPRAAELAEELVRALVQLYGAGLERILATLRTAAPDALAALGDDVLVAGLLALHDLQPRSVAERVEAALDDIRPLLGRHGGDVALLGVDEGVVRLRLEGACHGCGSSQATLEHAVEGAILAAAPEVARIDVEGAVAPPQHHSGLIPLESLLRCPSEVESLGAAPAGRGAG